MDVDIVVPPVAPAAMSAEVVEPAASVAGVPSVDSSLLTPAHEAAAISFAPPIAAAPTLDVVFEAAKLPLDVAIFNSARAAGGDEKIRRFLQAVLVVGGGSRIPGTAHALESRLQAIATPLVQLTERVQIIPVPKDVDAGSVAWKGGALLARMDSVMDLWVSREDWVSASGMQQFLSNER
jgi:actin-related protein 8